MSENLFYLQKAGCEIGPFTIGQLRSLWGHGEITVQMSFRRADSEGWQPVAVLRRDLEVVSPPPLPQAPPPLPTPQPKRKQISRSDTQLIGCLALFAFLLVAAIFVWFVASLRSPTQEEIAEAKHLREQDAAAELNHTNQIKADSSQQSNRPQQPSTTSDLEGERLVQSEKEKAREAGIRHQFSSWDGSHDALVEKVKLTLPRPKTFEHVETFHSDMGEYVHVSMRFTADNEFGNNQRLKVEAHSSLDGKQLVVMSLRDELSGNFLFEAGTEGVRVELVKARGETWKRDDGEEFTMVYIDWKNVGKAPVHAVKAVIRAKDSKGRIIDSVSVTEPYFVYAMEGNKAVQPGEIYMEPVGRGYILGSVKMLKGLGFRNADVRIEKAYTKRGLGDY